MGFKQWIRKNIRAFLQIEPVLNESYVRTEMDLSKNTKPKEIGWLAIDKWDKFAAPIFADDLKGKKCFAGLKLSTTDISSFVLLFPEGDRFLVISYFFIPEDSMEEMTRRDKFPYNEWVKKGKEFIFATNGNIIDYQFIQVKIEELAFFYQIEEIAYDPWNATMLTQRLAADGLTMVEVRQGFASISAPTKQLETLILQNRIRHDNNPVLRLMFSNIIIKHDVSGNIKPDEEKSKVNITGITALIMALERIMKKELNAKI
jgi:phage terminase large subunit-like protein